tara:strand:- start:8396 stop:8734 length:339 start_codon:yes stop_codon:yes gene_type:complete
MAKPFLPSHYEELCELIEYAIDQAFERDKFPFKCYNYLRQINASPEFIKRFKNSTTLKEVALMVSDLDAYLVDGDKQCTEAYGHLGTKKAEKIRNYLFRILNDTKTYESRYS